MWLITYVTVPILKYYLKYIIFINNFFVAIIFYELLPINSSNFHLFNFSTLQLYSVYIQWSPWRSLLHPAAWNTVSELWIHFCNLQCIEINVIFFLSQSCLSFIFLPPLYLQAKLNFLSFVIILSVPFS